MRLFFGLPLPHELLEDVSTVTDRLKERYPGVTVPRTEGLHITLHFFGERDDKEAEELKKVLLAPEVTLPAVEARFSEVGAFPPGGLPRVIFADIGEGRRTIISLQEILSGALTRAGLAVPDEKRPYHPHLTLGRVKYGSIDRTFLKGLALPLQPFTVTRCILFQSLLQREGAVYRPVAERRLEA
jgi:2'-5' RNA ligase